VLGLTSRADPQEHLQGYSTVLENSLDQPHRFSNEGKQLERSPREAERIPALAKAQEEEKGRRVSRSVFNIWTRRRHRGHPQTYRIKKRQEEQKYY